MRYRNARCVLSPELIGQIQEYVQGEYLYIPVKERCVLEPATDYKTELEKRNARIYTKHMEGVDNKQLAQIYHLSESSIRRILIKQRKGYRQMNDKINKILICWGLQDSEVKQIYDTAWQVGDEYVLKVYRSLKMLKRNLNTACRLAEMGIPVGQMLSAQGGSSYISDGEMYYVLSKKLSGSNRMQIDDAGKIAWKIGEILAKLHIALKECEDMEGLWDNSLLDEMNGWVKKNFEKGSWNYIDRETYEETVGRLAALYDQLPVQLIHRDVHFGNFLFDKGEFSGYIDFDLSQRNIRIFDLCYFLLGLLSDETFHLSEEQWFEFADKVFRGYESKLELFEAEKRAVPYVMECIELLFIAYFEGLKDSACARDAYKIFRFVRKQENKIWKSIQ